MLNLRKIIEDQQAFFKKMINDSLDKSFDRKYKKISLVLTLLILIVTSIFAYKANQILLLTSNSNNEVSMQLRRNSIRPILRVSTKRVSIGDNEGQALIISFANIGTGTAKDINLFIEDDKTFIREPIRRDSSNIKISSNWEYALSRSD